MNMQQKCQERVEIFQDAVRMEKRPSRIPFATNDAFWRYHDLGYKLSEALLDPATVIKANVEFVQRYGFDLSLDTGHRNPLKMTRSLGNFQYDIIDETNTLQIAEQCHFLPEDYDHFAKDPVKTLWERVMPRKYTYFTPDMELSTLQNTLGEFLAYNQQMELTGKTLMEECGIPPFFDPVKGASLYPAFECLYNFLRGMKGLSRDLRSIPEKVEQFNEVCFNTFTARDLAKLQPIDQPISAFGSMSIMLSNNMVNPKQFERFYWPHFQLIVERVVETNQTLYMLSEGTIKHLEPYLSQLPKGHFCFYVEDDDIFETRKRFPNLCLWGGIPINLLVRGTKQQCIDHVKRVIDEVGRDGGLVLCTDHFTCTQQDCDRENLLAVSDFVLNYNC